MSKLIDTEDSGRIVAKKQIWLTADKSRAVPDGHPEAAHLMAAAGHVVSHADAVRLGLVKPEPETMTNEEAQAAVASGEAEIHEEAEVEPEEKKSMIPPASLRKARKKK